MLEYEPIISEDHHTCVGLGLSLLDKLRTLEAQFSGLASKLYIASCEEACENIVSYIQHEPEPQTVEKEHVVVVLKLEIADRKGVLLLDPGYHVARVVTVMEDELYPHTGWFMQSKRPNCRKDYNYTLSGDGKYVVWKMCESKGGGLNQLSQSAVFVAQPFTSPIDVTERRNLVYNFRSLLSRDTKGHLTAGLFFPVSTDDHVHFTIFCEAIEGNKRFKMNFEDFSHTKNVLDGQQLSIVEECNRQLGFEPGGLFKILQTLANIFSDSDFISQVLSINEDINDMADRN